MPTANEFKLSLVEFRDKKVNDQSAVQRFDRNTLQTQKAQADNRGERFQFDLGSKKMQLGVRREPSDQDGLKYVAKDGTLAK
jgi:hypothetical protein